MVWKFEGSEEHHIKILFVLYGRVTCQAPIRGVDIKDQVLANPATVHPIERSVLTQEESAPGIKTGSMDQGPRRYYVNKGQLWTLRQRVSHGLHIIIVGMAMMLLANVFIFLTPVTLWSLYLAQIMNFLATIVVFFGVLSIYIRLRD
jgi:hypothetical protein